MKKLLIFLLFLILLPAKVFAADQININSATLQQLDELTGIGPVMAQRIVDARPFSSVDDLLRVKGIGPVTLQKIKTQNLACVNCVSAVIASSSASSLRGASEASNEAISSSANEIAASAAPPRNDVTGIYINEILPNPVGPDGLDEWVVTTIQRTGLAFS